MTRFSKRKPDTVMVKDRKLICPVFRVFRMHLCILVQGLRPFIKRIHHENLPDILSDKLARPNDGAGNQASEFPL